jgi:hypothetical protein
MRKLQYTARKIHRGLSYLLFLQLAAWIFGGVTFALLPFDSLVKGGASVKIPEPVALPMSWLETATAQQATFGPVDALRTVDSSQGPLLELRRGESSRWVRLADGATAVRPSPEQVGRYAQILYQGAGKLAEVRLLAAPEPRFLGLVDELYGRGDVWQAAFNDHPRTRLYFEGDNGRYITVRNDFWVFYDAMWRLHIMDYSGGEDFNNLLLRITVVLAFAFVLSGLVLCAFAARRVFLRRREAGLRKTI